MRRVGLFAILLCAVVLVGCASSGGDSAASQPAVTPALGLHSVGTTFTISGVDYRMESVTTSEATGRPEVELLHVTLALANVSGAKVQAFPPLQQDASVYSAQGDRRVLVASDSNASEFDSKSGVLGPAGTYQLRESFEVRKGEAGLVLSLPAGDRPDVRWAIR